MVENTAIHVLVPGGTETCSVNNNIYYLSIRLGYIMNDNNDYRRLSPSFTQCLNPPQGPVLRKSQVTNSLDQLTCDISLYIIREAVFCEHYSSLICGPISTFEVSENSSHFVVLH